MGCVLRAKIEREVGGQPVIFKGVRILTVSLTAVVGFTIHMLERGIEGERIALAQHLGVDQRGNINIVVGSFCHIGLMVGTVEPIAPTPLFGNMEVGK